MIYRTVNVRFCSCKLGLTFAGAPQF